MDFFEEITRSETRDLDVGAEFPKYAGVVLQVHVNTPGINEARYDGRAFTITTTTDENGKPTTQMHYDEISNDDAYRRERLAIARLFSIPLESTEKIEDSIADWLYGEAMKLREEWLEGLRKNSVGG